MIKRVFAAVIIICTALLQSGCAGATVYSNYKEISLLEQISAIGIDEAEDGKVEICAVTGGSVSGNSSRMFRGTGDSIASAVNVLRYTPVNKNAFFAHTEDIVIGSGTAKNGMEGVIDGMLRAAEIRTDTNMYITEEGVTAYSVLTETTGGNISAADILKFLNRDVALTGEGFVPNCGEVAAEMAAGGAALIAAVGTEESSDISEGSPEKMIVMTGFAVIKDGKLAFYVPKEYARGTAMLKNKMEYAFVTVPDEKGGTVTLGITKAKTELDPVYEDGELVKLNIKVKIAAKVLQSDGVLNFSDAAIRRDAAEKAAESELRSIVGAIELAQSENADFIGLGERVKRIKAVKYEKQGKEWSEIFPGLDIEAAVEVRIVGAYDIENSVPAGGGGNEESR